MVRANNECKTKYFSYTNDHASGYLVSWGCRFGKGVEKERRRKERGKDFSPSRISKMNNDK